MSIVKIIGTPIAARYIVIVYAIFCVVALNMSELNRYFRADIPFIAPEDGSKLLLRKSSFSNQREEEIEHNHEQVVTAFDSQVFNQLRGKREFAYHVMALMVPKNYGNIKAALSEMVAVEAEWEHKPFIREIDGEFKQVVPFSTHTSSFGGGFETTPAEEVQTEDDGPTKVAFEWRTNLY